MVMLEFYYPLFRSIIHGLLCARSSSMDFCHDALAAMLIMFLSIELYQLYKSVVLVFEWG